MVPMGPSEYTVASDSEKPANALTILLRFIIRDKRVGDGLRTQEGTGDVRSKMLPKIYILVNCSSQRTLDFHGGKPDSDESTAKLRHDTGPHLLKKG